jgi:LysM repeat protein
VGIQLEHRRLSITRVSGQGMAEISTERSVALPPDQADISDDSAHSILWAQGIPIVSSVEPMDGQVKVSGHVQSTVLYVAKGAPDFVAKAKVSEPGFEVVIPAPGVAVSDRAKVDLILSQLEVESTGTRGLLLAATLMASASALRDDVVDVAVSAEATGGSRISVYSEEISVDSVSQSFSESVQFSEVLSIPAEKGVCWGPGSACGAAGTARVVGARVANGKVVIDGEIAVEIATAVSRGVPALSILRFERVPIHVSFDVANSETEVTARAKLSFSELSVDVLSESEVRVYGTVDVEVDLVSSEHLSVIIDIDSETQEIVDTETRGIVVDRAVGEGSIDLDLQDSVALQSIMRHYPFTGMEDVSGSTGLLGLSDMDIIDDEVALRGLLTARAIFSDVDEDDDGQFPINFALDIPIEFSDTTEVTGARPGDRVEVKSATHSVVVDKSAPNRLDVEGSLRVDVAVFRPGEVQVVTSAEAISPVTLDPYAMTFYVVAEGDTLARIARRYGVPPDRIAAANGMSVTEEVTIGQKVYIPARR